MICRTKDIIINKRSCLTSRHLEFALTSLSLRLKYMLGVDKKAVFLTSLPSVAAHNSSTSLAMNSIVGFEYQYWFISAFSLCRAKNLFSLFPDSILNFD